MVGRQLPFMVPIVLFWIMAIMDGWRGVKETWPAVVVGASSFAIAQYLTSNFVGPELPDITAAIASLVSLTILFKYWQPKHIFRFVDQDATMSEDVAAQKQQKYTVGQIAKAWSPFAILTVMVTIWSVKPFKDLFAKDGALHDLVISIKVPFLHQMIQKMPPVVAEIKDYDAMYKFDWISATGTAIFIAALITSACW